MTFFCLTTSIALAGGIDRAGPIPPIHTVAPALTVRAQYQNGPEGGSINQLAMFGSWQLTNKVGIGPYVFLGPNSAEIDLAVNVKLGRTGIWVSPVAGLIMDSATGDLNYLAMDFIFGYSHPWLEFGSQNLYSDTADPDLNSELFQRAWIQFGKVDTWHSRFGIQTEIFSPQNEIDQFLRSTTKLGPRVSFMTGPLRLDLFYGWVVHDPTPDIDNDTEPTIRGWASFTFK